jgi:hypothetical protein
MIKVAFRFTVNSTEMKFFIASFLVVTCLATQAQRKSKEPIENWTGDYTGSFSDINGEKGELEITISDGDAGWIAVVLMRFDQDSILTGNLQVQRFSTEQIVFTPSHAPLLIQIKNF